MAFSKSHTLSHLLYERSQGSNAEAAFLDVNGKITKSLSYCDLFMQAHRDARRLLALGLKGNSGDVVISVFDEHESHIRIFWACCFAGIPFCPLPPLHPDHAARRAALAHIQDLFDGPTLLAYETTISAVKELIPDMKSVPLPHLDCTSADDEQFDSYVFPRTEPNPDDIACLMLTSGSTGNSKAVALRHSNILSSIRGKIKHHGTNSFSRFFNWIALHHVACFTEIHFHALEADASQYHVSSMAIIQRPINLLEWCSKHTITYTFSPNFLIAQLCRDVSVTPNSLRETNLTNLRVFISGGEAVPVRTAVDFADLLERSGAPRDALRAGFGMTETGAGCIYDRRTILNDPILYDTKYLSLGTCCDGTLVRIVNLKTGQTCAHGEIGQLQLSGPTVFREYYNNPSATEKSFTSDGWFITGDQAVFDSDNNLHMVGRDTDYVNINGVKHPSIDVENYVEEASIKGIIRSFVFVCPLRLSNADTETYCVFYLHEAASEHDLPVDHLQDIASTNDSIKRACAVFCSLTPHATLALPRKTFVKTALGKVSRTALAKAYLEGKFSSYEQQSREEITGTVANGDHKEPRASEDTVERKVLSVLSKLFSRSTSAFRRSDNIFDTGASSMQFMQLKHLLQESFGIPELPMIELLKRPEVGPLCDYVGQLSTHSKVHPLKSVYDPVICLHSKGSRPPLFLIHPFHGEILGFVDLALTLDDDRKVYAVRAKGFNHDEHPFASFDAMVSAYVSAIERHCSSGPIHLAGYSLGGAIAFDAAKALEKSGRLVAWVGVLDIPPNIRPLMQEMSWGEVMLILCEFLGLVLSKDLPTLRNDLQSSFPEADMKDGGPPAAADIVVWLLHRCDKRRFFDLHIDKLEFLRWIHIAFKLTSIARDFEPTETIHASMSVFRPNTPSRSQCSF